MADLSVPAWVRAQRYFFTRRSDYRAVFNTPAGRRVLADLYDFCGMNASSIEPGDAYATHGNEGRRRVGLRLQSILRQNDADIVRLADVQAQQRAEL